MALVRCSLSPGYAAATPSLLPPQVLCHSALTRGRRFLSLCLSVGLCPPTAILPGWKKQLEEFKKLFPGRVGTIELVFFTPEGTASLKIFS